MSKPEEHTRHSALRTTHRTILLAVVCLGAIAVLAALTDPRLLTLMLVGGVLAAMARGRS